MKPAFCLRIFLIAAIVSFIPSTALRGQQPPATAASTTMPSLITMCEDSDGCSDWGFKGSQGIGLWATGAIADLTITHLDATTIAIHRTDSKGAAAGVAADYTGTVSNFWIEGDLAASWPGHWQDVAHTKWHGMILPSQADTVNSAKSYEAMLRLSTAWTVCEDFGDKCSADKPPIDSLWVLSGKNGAMHLMQDESAQIFLYINELPDHQVTIRRFDKTGIVQGAGILYAGEEKDGELKGTFKTIWPGHGNSPGAGKWRAFPSETRCLMGTDIKKAKWIGTIANMREDKSASQLCYKIAASQGDSDAETVTGLYYYAGWGIPVDYKQSLEWLTRAADQDNPNALKALSAYYQQGKAVPVNLFLVHYFHDRAEMHDRDQSLFQTVVNGSGKGTMAALDMIGNLAAFFVLGGSDKTERLAARLGHEDAVLAYLSNGSSRVEAEEKVYHDEEMQRLKNSLENGSPCHLDTSGSDLPGGARSYIYLQRQQQSYERCQEGAQAREADWQQSAASYLSCVKQYVDSNAIEQHCKYFQ